MRRHDCSLSSLYLRHHPRALSEVSLPLLYSYPAHPRPILTGSIQKSQTENRNPHIQ